MVPSTRYKYLALNSTWFRHYITKGLRTVHDCYVAKVTENGDIEKLRRRALKINVDVEESKKEPDCKKTVFVPTFASVNFYCIYLIVSK